MLSRCGLVAGLLLMVSGIAGCGRYEDRVPVSGTVTLDGQPLKSGFIAFVGEQGDAVGVGPIRDGRYALSESGSRQGISSGSYQVRIESWEVEPGEEQPDGSFSKGKSAIPERYQSSSTSGLAANVTKKDRRFDFELTAKE